MVDLFVSWTLLHFVFETFISFPHWFFTFKHSSSPVKFVALMKCPSQQKNSDDSFSNLTVFPEWAFYFSLRGCFLLFPSSYSSPISIFCFYICNCIFKQLSFWKCNNVHLVSETSFQYNVFFLRLVFCYLLGPWMWPLCCSVSTMDEL